MSTATTSPAAPSPRRRWHKKFEAMIPAIVKYARFAFRHVRGQDRQDLIQETIANAMVSFRRLVRRGRESVAHASVLAKYAIRQIKDGRRVGSKLNVREMLSKYAQRHKGFHVERIDHYEPQEQEWTQTVVEDRTAGPADIARTRIDFSDWLDSLKRRDRRVAEFLAKGETTQVGGNTLQGLCRENQPVAPRACCQLASVPWRRPWPRRCQRCLIARPISGWHPATPHSPALVAFFPPSARAGPLFSPTIAALLVLGRVAESTWSSYEVCLSHRRTRGTDLRRTSGLCRMHVEAAARKP